MSCSRASHSPSRPDPFNVLSAIIANFQHEGDATISNELSTIYTNIQKIIDLRHKYLRISLQEPTDNPKDEPPWNVYPPPPPPQWIEERDSHSMTGSQTLNTDQRGGGSVSGHAKEGRKQGVAIGSDFVFEECEIPSEDEMEFKLDDMGVFQVYENQTGTSIFFSNLTPIGVTAVPDTN